MQSLNLEALCLFPDSYTWPPRKKKKSEASQLHKYDENNEKLQLLSIQNSSLFLPSQTGISYNHIIPLNIIRTTKAGAGGVIFLFLTFEYSIPLPGSDFSLRFQPCFYSKHFITFNQKRNKHHLFQLQVFSTSAAHTAKVSFNI